MARDQYVDISFWQGVVDWANLDSQIEGIILKTSEANFTDRMFPTYLAGVKNTGRKWGVYHFYRSVYPNTTKWLPGATQADLVVKTLAGEKPSLPVVLDIEALNGANAAAVARECKSFCERIQTSLGTTPMIYTSFGFMGNFYSALKEIEWMKNYPLWLAAYPWERQADFVTNFSLYHNKAVNGTYVPKAPYPWTHWDLWQWTGHGRVNGMRSDVDMNVSSEELGTGPSTPPTPPSTVHMYQVTASLGLRVRNDPNLLATIINVLPLGTQVDIYKVEGIWGFSQTYNGWMSMQWLKQVS
jgi:GH25 family lysozyme M1 (1,4-beta-N-acetylmuramidase)